MSFWKKKNKKITSQFWAGKFADEDMFNGFVVEDPDHYAEENEDKDYPISKFAASQGEWFYDHDFMEVTFSEEKTRTGEKFNISWIDKWADEFDQRIKKHGVSDVNSIVMMVVDNPPNGKPHRQISNPVSVSGEGFELVYLGEIEYDD